VISRRLGFEGPNVAALGLGCMGMSVLYGPADEDESLATIRAALDAGITLLDTGDYYGRVITSFCCEMRFAAGTAKTL
jgi:aryl-alcohol dehydrogenase-like predicted oxidoreductase